MVRKLKKEDNEVKKQKNEMKDFRKEWEVGKMIKGDVMNIMDYSKIKNDST